MRSVIGFLRGVVKGSCVVAGDVGYVVVSADELSEGEQVELFVHTVVREQSLTLYGFRRAEDEAVFARLLGVRGVGPALALSVVRSLGAEQIVAAVRDENLDALRAVKGVGLGAARSIVSELKVGDLEVTPREQSSSEVSDLASTLVGLGWDSVKAFDTARVALRELPEGTESERIRWSLAHLRPKTKEH